MIENIEHFRAELEFSPLFHREIFERREVGVLKLIFLCVSFFGSPFVGSIHLLRPRSVAILHLERNTDTAGSLQ